MHLKVEFDGVEINGTPSGPGRYLYDLNKFGLGILGFNSEDCSIEFSGKRRVNFYHRDAEGQISSARCASLYIYNCSRIALPANNQPGNVVITLN